MSAIPAQPPPADTARQVRDRVRRVMNRELDRQPEREKLLRVVEILAVDSRREGLLVFKEILTKIIKDFTEEYAGAPSNMDLYFNGKLSAYMELEQLILDEIGNL